MILNFHKVSIVNIKFIKLRFKQINCTLYLHHYFVKGGAEISASAMH